MHAFIMNFSYISNDLFGPIYGKFLEPISFWKLPSVDLIRYNKQILLVFLTMKNLVCR